MRRIHNLENKNKKGVKYLPLMPIYNASKQRMLLRENRNEAYGQSRNVHKLKQIYFSMDAEAQFKEEK